MHSAENKINTGVTIIVWLPTQQSNESLPIGSSSSIIRNGISLGHAALRTYSGGPNGQGCYLSFWGGDSRCGCCYVNRESSHFHTVKNDDEDCYKYVEQAEIIKRHEIHLDIVNVESVNQRILEIIGAKGRIWGIQQNCSDLVLEALRAGVSNFSSHIYQRPYGWKTRIFFTVMSVPLLFILRNFFTDWNAASVENEFVQKFFSVLKLPE